jgi:hypothetical protein
MGWNLNSSPQRPLTLWSFYSQTKRVKIRYNGLGCLIKFKHIIVLHLIILKKNKIIFILLIKYNHVFHFN